MTDQTAPVEPQDNTAQTTNDTPGESSESSESSQPSTPTQTQAPDTQTSDEQVKDDASKEEPDDATKDTDSEDSAGDEDDTQDDAPAKATTPANTPANGSVEQTTAPADAEPVEKEKANPVTTGPVPTTVEPVELQQRLTRLFNEVDNVVSRVESNVAAHVDVAELREHLFAARDWLATKLGLEKAKDGSYVTHAGFAGGSTALGQTTAQAEASKKDK